MPQLARTVATLRVIGQDLDPGEITRLLGCRADRAYARGDTIDADRRNQQTARHGLWMIHAAPREPGDLDGQIAELLARVTGDLDAWAAIRARHRIDLFCGLFMSDLNEGLVVSAASLVALGARGIELDLDVYGQMAPSTDVE